MIVCRSREFIHREVSLPPRHFGFRTSGAPSGDCQRRLNKYKRIADAKEYRETHPKQNLNACA